MIRAVPFTQAGLRRAIEAVRKAGLRVKAIRLEIIVDEQSAESNPQAIESVEKEDEVML
jgi:ribosomal protein L13E